MDNVKYDLVKYAASSDHQVYVVVFRKQKTVESSQNWKKTLLENEVSIMTLLTYFNERSSFNVHMTPYFIVFGGT